MLLTYGRGRAEQFRLHPSFGSALNFVPPLFCLYLLSLLALRWVGSILLAPLLIYGAAVLGQAIALARRGNTLLAIAAMPLIVLTHLMYGVGFWRGLFTRLKSEGEDGAAPVSLETISR